MTMLDLDRVLAWRNHKEVRRYMYSQHEIGLSEHTRWFERASQDADRHLLIYEEDAVPLGFINICQIAFGGIADWGFYVAPDSPKGTGKKMGRTVLKYAFSEIKLHKVCGHVLENNKRSIIFHLSLGFQLEGNQREQFFDGHQYHNALCFGMLASQWQELYQED